MCIEILPEYEQATAYLQQSASYCKLTFENFTRNLRFASISYFNAFLLIY